MDTSKIGTFRIELLDSRLAVVDPFYNAEWIDINIVDCVGEPLLRVNGIWEHGHKVMEIPEFDPRDYLPVGEAA